MQPQDLPPADQWFYRVERITGILRDGLMLTPRRRFRRLSDQSLITWPLRTIRPASRRALSASRPIMACAVVVSRAGFSDEGQHSPRWMEKLMLCTTSRHSPASGS